MIINNTNDLYAEKYFKIIIMMRNDNKNYKKDKNDKNNKVVQYK